MNEDLNPYKSPNSSVTPEPAVMSEPHFFTTSSLKLILMCLCTLGLYQHYWFYKNWVLIKKRTGEKMMPFWRAFFAIIFAYSCFKEIKKSAVENQIPESLTVGFLAVIFIVLQASWRLPDPYWIASLFTFAPILAANSLALKINKNVSPEFSNNDKFSGWNWLTFVLGGLLLALALIGTLIPDNYAA